MLEVRSDENGLWVDACGSARQLGEELLNVCSKVIGSIAMANKEEAQVLRIYLAANICLSGRKETDR